MGKRASTEHPTILPGPVYGMNSRAATSQMEPGSYAVLKNCEWSDDVGIFRLRRGTTKIGAVAIPANGPYLGGIRWYYGATPTGQTVFAHFGDLYTGDSSPSSIGSGFNSTAEFEFEPYDDILYCSNGVDAMRRWNPASSQLRTAGFTAPVGAPTAVAGGGGGLGTGTYKWKVTFTYDSDVTHESSAGPESAGTAIAGTNADLSSIPTGGTGCTGRRIYRTKANGNLFYFVANISDNAATTYTDSTPDSSLAANQAPTDNGIPPLGNVFAIYQNRMYVVSATRRNRLHFSAIASTERNPTGTLSVHGAGVEIFPSDHWVDVGDENTPINALAIWGDAVVIFKEHEIWLLRGGTAADFRLWNTGNAVGCIARRTVVNMGLDYGIWFLGKAETSPMVYAFTGDRARPVSLPMEPYFRTTMDTSYTIVKPCAARYRGRYIISYRANPTTFEFADCDTNVNLRWCTHTGVSASVFIPYTGPSDTGQLYFSLASQGTLLQWDSAYHGDYNAAAESNPVDTALQIQTGWMRLGDAHQIKQMKWIYVVIDFPSGLAANLTIRRFYDFAATGSVTVSGASFVAMEASNNDTGRTVFVHRVECEYSTGSDCKEAGWFVKLLVELQPTVPNATTASDPLRIHEIGLYYEEHTPEYHP